MDRQLFFRALKDSLDGMSFPWGEGEKPGDAKPYGIIYPMVTVPTWGRLAIAQEAGWTYAQLTLVGISQDQVLWASDKTLHRLLDAVNGSYVQSLTFTGGTVVLRECLQSGAAVRNSDNIYVTNDSYRFLLEAT